MSLCATALGELQKNGVKTTKTRMETQNAADDSPLSVFSLLNKS
jgi:hypothetical protein